MIQLVIENQRLVWILLLFDGPRMGHIHGFTASGNIIDIFLLLDET